MKIEPLSKATHLLEELRLSRDFEGDWGDWKLYYEIDNIDAIKKYLATANKTPKDIGTTDEELEEFLVHFCLTLAKCLFTEVLERYNKRYNEEDIYCLIEEIRDLLTKANKTPKDIGTTDERLEKLFVQDCLVAAKNFLEMLKEIVKNNRPECEILFYISDIKDLLKKAGKKPKDIGTTNKELEKFRIQGCLINAKRLFNDLIGVSHINEDGWYYDVDWRFDDYFQEIRKWLKKAGKKPKDIGISEISEIRLEKGINADLALNEFLITKERLKSVRKEMLKGSVYDQVQDIKSYLKEFNKTPEDIGTTDEELKKIYTTGSFSEAKKILREFRKARWRDVEFSWKVGCLKADLVTANKTLADAGTSKKEIKGFGKKLGITDKKLEELLSSVT